MQRTPVVFEILSPAELAIRLYNERVKPVLDAIPRQQAYPPIELGPVMPDETRAALWHACRHQGYDAEFREVPAAAPCAKGQPAQCFYLDLVRLPADHERGAGDEYPDTTIE